MRELLSAYGKRFAVWLGVAAFLVFLELIRRDETGLIGAFLLGYVAAAVCAWILVYRTWRSSGLDLARAKKQMWIGMVLRLFTMFIVFWAAIQISLQVFGAVVAGFLVFSILAMLQLMLLNYHHVDKK